MTVKQINYLIACLTALTVVIGGLTYLKKDDPDSILTDNIQISGDGGINVKNVEGSNSISITKND